MAPDCASDWIDGWWGSAIKTPSPNFGPRPSGASIDLIVVHSISLPPGEFGNGKVHALFTNSLDWDAHPYFSTIRGLEVSAHFFISRTAEVFQFVSCDARAWHAGQSFYRGRGNCNDDSIGIELEGIEGGPFEEGQYLALAKLCKSLQKQYLIAHIAGHEHIAPSRKSDPGAGFDWGFLQQLTEMPTSVFPEAIQAPKFGDLRASPRS